jgi:hypothetical protein
MAVRPEKKSRCEPLRRILLVLLAILLLITLICCGVSVYGIIGPPDPPERVVISSKDNLCLDFTPPTGTGEELTMFTHYCDVQLKKNQWGIVVPDKGTYLDVEYTMECPWVTISDKDGDGFQEITMHQDPVCKEFAHGYAEATNVTYKVTKEGQIIVIDSH